MMMMMMMIMMIMMIMMMIPQPHSARTVETVLLIAPAITAVQKIFSARLNKQIGIKGNICSKYKFAKASVLLTAQGVSEN